MLGETTIKPAGSKDKGDQEKNDDEDFEGISEPAKIWIKQNGISKEQIEQVFHISNGNAEVIASEIPGDTKKVKTINVYALAAISNLLTKGDSTFDDKAARSLCEKSGCYDSTNHASHISTGMGNKFSGTKALGWKLTAPGLKYAAEIIKTIATNG